MVNYTILHFEENQDISNFLNNNCNSYYDFFEFLLLNYDIFYKESELQNTIYNKLLYAIFSNKAYVLIDVNKQQYLTRLYILLSEKKEKAKKVGDENKYANMFSNEEMIITIEADPFIEPIISLTKKALKEYKERKYTYSAEIIEFDIKRGNFFLYYDEKIGKLKQFDEVGKNFSQEIIDLLIKRNNNKLQLFNIYGIQQGIPIQQILGSIFNSFPEIHFTCSLGYTYKNCTHVINFQSNSVNMVTKFYVSFCSKGDVAKRFYSAAKMLSEIKLCVDIFYAVNCYDNGKVNDRSKIYFCFSEFFKNSNTNEILKKNEMELTFLERRLEQIMQNFKLFFPEDEKNRFICLINGISVVFYDVVYDEEASQKEIESHMRLNENILKSYEEFKKEGYFPNKEKNEALSKKCAEILLENIQTNFHASVEQKLVAIGIIIKFSPNVDCDLIKKTYESVIPNFFSKNLEENEKQVLVLKNFAIFCEGDPKMLSCLIADETSFEANSNLQITQSKDNSNILNFEKNLLEESKLEEPEKVSTIIEISENKIKNEGYNDLQLKSEKELFTEFKRKIRASKFVIDPQKQKQAISALTELKKFKNCGIVDNLTTTIDFFVQQACSFDDVFYNNNQKCNDFYVRIYDLVVINIKENLSDIISNIYEKVYEQYTKQQNNNINQNNPVIKALCSLKVFSNVFDNQENLLDLLNRIIQLEFMSNKQKKENKKIKNSNSFEIKKPFDDLLLLQAIGLNEQNTQKFMFFDVDWNRRNELLAQKILAFILIWNYAREGNCVISDKKLKEYFNKTKELITKFTENDNNSNVSIKQYKTIKQQYYDDKWIRVFLAELFTKIGVYVFLKWIIDDFLKEMQLALNNNFDDMYNIDAKGWKGIENIAPKLNP